jgi:hypothetical protein
LSGAPFGLTREAQRLVMAAMVAQRQFDFVTSKGDRINYRSLDLQIIWDDIVAIARPLNELYSSERLLTWARLVTGNPALRSVERSEDRPLIVVALADWLAGWTGSRVLADFDALPDELLSAGIWRTASNLRKSFGAMAEIIESVTKDDISLDVCLQSIADLFCDSEQEYESKKLDLRTLKLFISGIRRRTEIISYLSLCERTGGEAIESVRLELIANLDTAYDPSAPNSREQLISRWEEFQRQYADYYADRHNRAMRSAAHGESLKEIIRSNQWAVFENLASSASQGSECFAAAKNLIRELRQLDCQNDVRQHLTDRPFCGCSFSLREAERLEKLPDELRSLVDAGVTEIIDSILSKRDALTASADSGAMRSSVGSILDRLATGTTPGDLSSQEVRLLRLTLENANDPRSGRPEVSATAVPEEELELWETEVLRVEDFVNTELKM